MAPMESPKPGPGGRRHVVGVGPVSTAKGHARSGPRGEGVVGALVCAGPARAGPVPRGVDDVRVVGSDVVHVDLQFRADARQLVGEEHVGCRRQLYRCRAVGGVRSRPMLLLPRLECSRRACTSPAMILTPEEASPRMASPRCTCSTLMTSAPQSASSAEAAGTKVCSATSRMRTPSHHCSHPVPSSHPEAVRSPDDGATSLRCRRRRHYRPSRRRPEVQHPAQGGQPPGRPTSDEDGPRGVRRGTATSRSRERSRGMPSTRSLITLRAISVVPPPMQPAGA